MSDLRESDEAFLAYMEALHKESEVLGARIDISTADFGRLLALAARGITASPKDGE